MRIAFWSSLLVLTVTSGAILAAAPQPTADSVTQTLVAQTRCPVMGGKIDSAFYTDIQGQRVYHCCGGCGDKLAADPDRYFEKAAAQGVLFENIQTRCPVSGKAIDDSVYLDYRGRRIYFSSDKSRERFLAKPAKFLAKLPGQPEPPREEENHDAHQSGGHGGHGGGCGM